MASFYHFKNTLPSQLDWQSHLEIIHGSIHFGCQKNDLFLHSNALDAAADYHQQQQLERLGQDVLLQISKQLKSIPEAFDGESFIGQLEKGRNFDLIELHPFFLFLEFLANAPNALMVIDEKCKRKLLPIIAEFRLLINPSGELIEDKHPRILSLGQKLKMNYQQAQQAFNELIASKELNQKLVFNHFDLRDHMYVMGVKSDAYNQKMGHIIARSNTGQMLYVCPVSLEKLSSERRSLVNERLHILYQLSVEIVQKITPLLKELLISWEQTLATSLSLSKINVRERLKLNIPTFSTCGEIEVEGLFHPLLTSPIKNSMVTQFSQKGVLLSGPNTGGKTVFLKSIMICSLLAQSGFGACATSCRLPFFDHFGIFLASDQDLARGLSGFSADVSNFSQLLSEIKPNSLIIIDEIFSSTSSEEASALAIGIITEILKHPAVFTLITTHHHYLKNYISQKKLLISAHMGFDPEKLTPTYRVHWNYPGSSKAIEIFKQWSQGNPAMQNALHTAQMHLDQSHLQSEKLLAELEKTREQLSLQEIELHQKMQEVQGMIFLEKQKLNAQFQKAVQSLEKPPAGPILFPEVIKTLPQVKHTERPKAFLVGNTYFSASLAVKVKLLQLNHANNTALVMVGMIKKEVPLEDLSAEKGSESKKIKNSVNVFVESSNENLSTTFDGRGLRLNVFQDEIEYYLDQLRVGNIPFLLVIHGHGTGQLKYWLREYLKKQPDLTFEIDEPSQDGATIIKLK